MRGRRYNARCSCGAVWQLMTADQLEPIVCRHDDSPWGEHVVTVIRSKGRTDRAATVQRDADFEAARLRAAARLRGGRA